MVSKKALSLESAFLVIVDFIFLYHSEFSFGVSLPTSTLINNFNDMLDTLVSYRNICAHGHRLYNHRVRKGKHTRKLLFFHLIATKGSETSLWVLILTLRLFLPYHDYYAYKRHSINSLTEHH